MDLLPRRVLYVPGLYHQFLSVRLDGDLFRLELAHVEAQLQLPVALGVGDKGLGDLDVGGDSVELFLLYMYTIIFFITSMVA